MDGMAMGMVRGAPGPEDRDGAGRAVARRPGGGPAAARGAAFGFFVRRAALGAALVAGLAGCALDGRDGAGVQARRGAGGFEAASASFAPPSALPPLTALAPGVDPVEGQNWTLAAALPPGWEPWVLHPTKRRTLYRVEQVDGLPALRAEADASASGLAVRLSVDPNERPIAEWRWRVERLIPGADVTDRHAEDSPVRVVFAFDGDKGSLPVREKMFFERARLLAGQELPYATLMYVWENRQPVGATLQNPHTSRVRKIVVSSGEEGLGRWKSFRRDLVEDYRQAFGADPGRLIGVAIMTDTDNTRERATAHYGDIRLVQR